MKYSKFKEYVINHMNDVVYHMPEKPEAGQWQGKGEPKAYILGKPSSQKERAEMINKYALLKSVKHIDHKKIHLHQYAHHMNSSQIICYNFFRPLMEDADGEMHAKESLVKLIGHVIGEELEHQGGTCNFEYIDHSKEKTNFDFYFKNGSVEVLFEVKYTEQPVGGIRFLN